MTNNQIAYMNALELKRANLSKEGISRDTLDETKRSNIAGEGIKHGTLAESIRHNQATEGVAVGQLDISRLLANEQRRSNLAREGETHRSNVAKELENQRSNLANELLTGQRDQRSYEVNVGNLEETVRHHKTGEVLTGVEIGSDLAGDILKMVPIKGK